MLGAARRVGIVGRVQSTSRRLGARGQSRPSAPAWAAHASEPAAGLPEPRSETRTSGIARSPWRRPVKTLNAARARWLNLRQSSRPGSRRLPLGRNLQLDDWPELQQLALDPLQ
jgi:hypothetical protein